MKKLILNTAKNIILMFAVMFLLWLLVSWIDIVSHNDPVTGSHEYIQGNAFVLLTEGYN